MSTHKHFDKICCVVLALTLVLTAAFMNGEKLGLKKSSTVLGYETMLFDTSKVHTLNIVMNDWDEFTENCKSEEYYNCTVVIDNEAYKNVAIRGKGNTSLTQVEAYGNDRYSFKIEFDHYDAANTYYGLDKLCLNNIIQDNTYIKDYLTYQMMNDFGVASPLCSFVYITVNGDDWGLYLAVECVEESFLQRNYGKDYGKLYKPDSMNMGGGRGNGKQFNFDNFLDSSESVLESDTESKLPHSNASFTQKPSKRNNDENNNKNKIPLEIPENPFESAENKGDFKGGGFRNGSDDVLLKYIDDEAESYSNIFDNAKTQISESDKQRLIKALKQLSENEEIESTVDTKAVIRYFVIHNFVLNFDSYTGSMIHNYYLYEKDGQMQMIPWDYNLAFGGFQSMGGATSLINYPIDSPVSGGNTEDRPMIAWIFSNEEYTQIYHEYFAEFIAEYFESGYFEDMINCVNELIKPYVEKDPTKFCTYDEFERGISTLKEFCLLRAESIKCQLNGTIGSTTDTQADDTLIQANSIQISDMGSMNNTMGGDMQNPFENTAENNPTENGEKREDNQTDKNAHPIPPEDFSNGDMTPPQMPSGENDANFKGGSMPQMPDHGRENQANSQGSERAEENRGEKEKTNPISASTIILGTTSIAVLAGGIIFAIKFKKRK